MIANLWNDALANNAGEQGRGRRSARLAGSVHPGLRRAFDEPRGNGTGARSRPLRMGRPRCSRTGACVLDETVRQSAQACRTSWHRATKNDTLWATLARTASDITAQTRPDASATIAEISRRVKPRQGAESRRRSRWCRSDSMVRDTAMLDERAQPFCHDTGNPARTVNRVDQTTCRRRRAGGYRRRPAERPERDSLPDQIEGPDGKLASTVAAQVTGDYRQWRAWVNGWRGCRLASQALNALRWNSVEQVATASA